MERDWTAARVKVTTEGACRVCGSRSRLEAAHIIGRSHDSSRIVNPLDVVPLCGDQCHRAYDAHDLDLLPYLSLAEQARAVGHVGIIRALARISSVKKPSPERISRLGRRGSTGR